MALTVCSILTNQSTTKLSWINEIVEYIRMGSLLEDKGKVGKVKRKTPSYELVDGQL